MQAAGEDAMVTVMSDLALIDVHERRRFWEAMDAVDPDEYEAQAREEGTWPTEGCSRSGWSGR